MGSSGGGKFIGAFGLVMKVVGDAELCRNIDGARNPKTGDHLQHGFRRRDIRIARLILLGQFFTSSVGTIYKSLTYIILSFG